MVLASQEKLSISPVLAVWEEKKGRETYKPSVRVYCSFKYNKTFPILGDRKSLTPRCTMTLAISCPHNTVFQHFNAVSRCCFWPMRTLFVLYVSLNLGSKNTEHFVMLVLLLDTILSWGVESKWRIFETKQACFQVCEKGVNSVTSELTDSVTSLAWYKCT